MTDTAKMADIILPATMFLEHDDLYYGGGQQYLSFGKKLIEAPEGCKSNHEVICALAKRLGAEHAGFSMTPREMIDWTLKNSGWGSLDQLAKNDLIDCQPDFETAHYLKGFNWPDGKYRFKVDWSQVPLANDGPMGPFADLPTLPDHWNVLESATKDYPFRLATSPSRQFLNSTFTETESSIKREGRPTVMIHPLDAAKMNIQEGDEVELSNERGAVRLHAHYFEVLQQGVLIAEGIWPNSAHPDGRGINTLTGADQAAPFGGAAFHDNHVAIRPYLQH
jgi:anaerobic selenocysteine-containing dehydrogenase